MTGFALGISTFVAHEWRTRMRRLVGNETKAIATIEAEIDTKNDCIDKVHFWCGVTALSCAGVGGLLMGIGVLVAAVTYK